VKKGEYRAVAIINIVLALLFLGCGIAAIVFVFKANFAYAIGFAIIAVISFWIFRHVPWPETDAEALERQIRSVRRTRW